MLHPFYARCVFVFLILFVSYPFHVPAIPSAAVDLRDFSSNGRTSVLEPGNKFSFLTFRATIKESLSSPSTTILKPPNLLLFVAFSLILGSLIKSFHIVPFQHHPQVDQLVVLFAASLVTIFFLDRVLEASAAGYLSLHRFSQYFLAGGICAFVTHALCTPIDVVKTRIQTKPGKYSGTVDAFYKIVSEEGPLTLLKGLGATASGYFLHGAFKYSFYEVFKLLFSSSPTSAVKPPLSIAALSGFLAECIACVFLCPLEAIRIRSVADSTFPTGVISGLSLLYKTEGFHGWFKGLIAMLLKQVPYTVGQFVSFEFSVKFVRSVIHATVGVQNASSAVAFISTVAGLLAGITAAVISHPGDTILSKINQDECDASAISQIAKVARTTGFSGMFVGLGPRLLQVSCMMGGQFMIYDSIKLWCGITPASALPAHGHSHTVDAAALSSTSTTTPMLSGSPKSR